MSLQRVSKKLLSLAISSMAFATAAHADSGYQPYYYDRDVTQYSQTPAATPVQTVSETDRSQTQYGAYAVPGTPAIHPTTQAPVLNVQSQDWQKTVAAPAPVVTNDGDSVSNARGSDLGTRGGLEIGLQGSNYHYQEHVVADSQFMRQTGIKVGLTASGTATMQYGFFFTGEARLAYSKNDYFSDPTGKISNFADDFLGEGRALLGKDFLLGSSPAGQGRYDLSPYVGIGYRNLYNDSDGIDGGYRRNSEYFYVPMGLTQRFRVASNARVSVNAEYDYLMLGRQTTYASDIDPGNPDIVTDQRHGRGMRGSVMYEWSSISVGPFLEYWNINKSVEDVIGDEPHNETLEYGAQIRYRFR